VAVGVAGVALAFPALAVVVATAVLVGVFAAVRSRTSRALLPARGPATTHPMPPVHTVLEALPQAVLLAGPDGAVERVGLQLASYSGLTEEALRGPGWLAAVHPEERAAAAAGWRRTASGEAASVSLRLRRADGAYRWHRLSVSPLRGDRGRIVGWLGALADIHAEKELEAARAAASEAHEVFLSVASHELRTPLAAARLQLEGLRRAITRAASPELASALARRIAGAAEGLDRLSALVDSAFDASRLEAGDLALAHAPYELSDAVAGAVARFAEAARHVGSSVEVELEDSVWSRGDRPRIEQVVTGLLANALKFGRGEPIRVALHRRGDRALLTVADHGVGIAPEHQGRIFERFDRGGAPRDYGGLGLGLWIARQVVVASGGRIGVKSAPGEGATFTVELPAEPRPVEAASAGPAG
jgi:PAS domain S-box-containing protein